MSFNLRRRQIDVEKPILVFLGDIPDIGVETNLTRCNIESNVSNMSQEEQNEKHLHDILRNPKQSTQAIPTPIFHLVPDYEPQVELSPFNPSYLYVRHAAVEAHADSIEYDLDGEDTAWLSNYNRQMAPTTSPPLSSTTFEYLIDFYEKRNNLAPPIQSVLDTALRESRPELDKCLVPVGEYWASRIQRRYGHPLLRRYLSHADEAPPYQAFIGQSKHVNANQKRTTSLSGQQTSRTWKIMQILSRNFSHLHQLLTLIRRREIFKRKRLICIQRWFALQRGSPCPKLPSLKMKDEIELRKVTRYPSAITLLDQPQWLDHFLAHTETNRPPLHIQLQPSPSTSHPSEAIGNLSPTTSPPSIRHPTSREGAVGSRPNLTPSHPTSHAVTHAWAREVLLTSYLVERSEFAIDTNLGDLWFKSYSVRDESSLTHSQNSSSNWIDDESFIHYTGSKELNHLVGKRKKLAAIQPWHRWKQTHSKQG